jgi:EAL domain-containing protein (putative c-di-GMP-specific phosphodiesterase class I)
MTVGHRWMNGLVGTVRARTRTFLGATAVVMLLLIAVTSMLVGSGMAAISRTQSARQAAQAVDLLGIVGASFPNLTPFVLAHGLSPADAHRLDVVTTRVQRDGLLADIEIWDRGGRIVYSNLPAVEGTRPPKQPELIAALAGHSVTETHPTELDPASGKRTGVLDALRPLISDQGAVYGALEVDLPLTSVETTAAGAQRRGILFVIGGGVLMCVLLAPLWVRLMRSLAADWIPGRRKTLRAVREALEHGTIELVYQPQIEPGGRRVVGVEALVRWRRSGQLVGPDRFMAAVEGSALMPRLTDRVLDLAFAQIAIWRRASIVVRVSVNLSSTDLADRTVPHRIAAGLDRYGITGEGLTVEVTETAILDDLDRAAEVLSVIDQMGIDIALDDFGTGHSSIARLHGLPVFSELKIDRSFVSDTQERSRTYLKAIVAFGQSLGLRIVAEGVEDEETLVNLANLDCDLAQGYLISRPLEPAAMTHWLLTHPTRPTAALARGTTVEVLPNDAVILSAN